MVVKAIVQAALPVISVTFNFHSSYSHLPVALVQVTSDVYAPLAGILEISVPSKVTAYVTPSTLNVFVLLFNIINKLIITIINTDIDIIILFLVFISTSFYII